MTGVNRSLDRLGHPPVQGLDPRSREYLAYEATVIGQAARGRAYALRASGHRGVELAVVELEHLAQTVLRRAHRYQHEDTTSS